MKNSADAQFFARLFVSERKQIAYMAFEKLHTQISRRLIATSRSEMEDKMRLDKYLKVARIIKRRPVANEACDAGRILVNGKVAKASLAVKPGDVIEIGFGNKQTKIEVLSTEETYNKEEAKELFKYL